MKILNNLNIFTENNISPIIPKLDKDSHKGQNGKTLIVVGGSPLFHGAGRLAGIASLEVITKFSSITNDMVFFCSTKENIEYLKERYETFIGIERSQLDHYLNTTDVVILGPGLMREKEEGLKETENEPFITEEITEKVLMTEKKIIIDAGSLQIIAKSKHLKNILKGRKNTIITPHIKEMQELFNIPEINLQTSQNQTFMQIKNVGERVLEMAKEYNIVILLKGPIDIIADKNDWRYIVGGNPGMTKGGTGDVLAGVVGALYSRIENPMEAACVGSLITKKTGELLWKKDNSYFDASDLARSVGKTIDILRNNLVQ